MLITAEPYPAFGALERARSGGPEEATVLVATDGSEESVRAGKYAARLAGGLGAKLTQARSEHLLYVRLEDQSSGRSLHRQGRSLSRKRHAREHRSVLAPLARHRKPQSLASWCAAVERRQGLDDLSHLLRHLPDSLLHSVYRNVQNAWPY
jgi:hypothetical protein